MAVAEVSIEPLGTCSPSIGNIITDCVETLKGEPGIKFDVEPMGTVIEGDRRQILSAVERMEDACFKAGAERVVTTIRLDERRDKAMSAQQMENEVKQHLSA